jgi:hypothetical protein
VIGGGEAFEEFLFAAEKFTNGLTRGQGFDVALDTEKFLLDLPAVQGFETAFGLLPGALLGRLEEDFEEEAAVAFVEKSANLGGLQRLIRESRDDQSREDLLGFEALIEASLLEALSNLAAKALGLYQHTDEATFGGLGSSGDQLRLGLDLAAAFVGGFAECGAKDGFVNP